MSFKKNIIANYLGTAWVSLMSLLFIPLYIKYMGIEAYGLIGIYAMLQAWLGLADMGLTPTLGREMARFTGGAVDAQYIRNLLRSITTVAFCIALIISIGIWLSSTWLATSWLKADKLPVEVVSQAFTIMGLVTALRFLEGIYRSAIAGLQRQVILNMTSSIIETLRGLGAVGVLIFIAPTIEVFFVWQAIISILSLSVYAFIVHSTIPKPPLPPSFSLNSLNGIKSFASGMLLTTLLALLLTQVDKLLLVRMLSLEEFGHYTLAFVVSSAIYRLAGPVTQAIYPKLVELEARGNNAELVFVYHRGSQFITVLMAPAVIMLMIYTDVILSLWTQNSKLSSDVALLVAILSAGVFLNGIMQLPHLLQLAHNWTSLCVKTNAIAICFVVPALLWFVPIYGVYGAAWIWVALNIGCDIFMLDIMHRRILKNEKWKWYFQDVIIPFLVALAVALLLRTIWSPDLSNIEKIIGLAISSLATISAAIFAAPIMRREIALFITSKIKST